MTDDYTQMRMSLFPDDSLDEEASYHPLMAFPRQPASPAPMVKSLRVANFKGFRELTLDLGTFNVLVGPNNCGKSTILQAIDLCFRLLQFHAEFHGGELVKPRAGKQIIGEMLPVASGDDFWFQRKYRAGNDRIPVVLGMKTVEGLEFEFEIKRQWGGLNSRMTRVPLGLSETTVRHMLDRRPTLVPSSVGIVRYEEYRVPARLELLSLTGHHNEVLRNLLYELGKKSPEAFQGLQTDLKKHFGGSVQGADFSLERDQYISVNYEDALAQHDIFSAGAGFLQVLQLLTYLASQAPGIVLLDEPDAHLHSSLQRLVVDLLEGLSRHERIQVVMATHSKEIINYVDASYIVPISRENTTAQPLEHHASVMPVLQDLGAVDNVDLAALVGSKRCVFVEGGSDKRLLARFAARFDSTVFEGFNQVVIICTEGVDNAEKCISLEVFERFVGSRIRSLFIRDRDGLPDDAVREICEFASRQGRNVICLGKTHMENYLLLPKRIWRVLCAELLHGGSSDESLPTLTDVEEEMEAAVDSLYNDTFDSIAAQVNKHYVVYHNQHLDPRTVNQKARESLDGRWRTLDEKLAVVLGKKALAAIRTRCQERWGVSLTETRLVESMTEEEIPQEIKDIVHALECL